MDHTICHFEIPADAPQRAAEFYRELFDWDIRSWDSADNNAEIQMIKTVPTDATGQPIRPGVNGMIMKRQHPQQPFANYILVESVEEYGAKAVALGGQIVMPKTAVPGMGWFLYFMDTEGNILGLWQSDPSAA
jgi:predicted enzyme related to lactoylglutathione lyase